MSTGFLIGFIALFIAQAITTPIFLRKEIPNPCLKSLIWKMVCSTLFVGTAVLAVFSSENHTLFSAMMLIGFGFSWLGDFLLHVKAGDKLFFVLGLFSFMFGHICYITAYTSASMYFFPDAPFMGIPEMAVFIIFICSGLFSLNNLKVEFGEAYLPCLIYMNVIAVMLCKACSLAFRIISSGVTDNSVFTAVVLISGAVMFVISDYTLSILTFVKGIKKHGALRNINIWTYFFGQMLLALTILYIVPIA